MHRRLAGTLVVAIVTLAGSGCGGSGGSTPPVYGPRSDLSAAAPFVAVGSPVARSGGATASSPTQRVALVAAGEPLPPPPGPEGDGYGEQLAAIGARLEGTTVRECLAGIALRPDSGPPSCFGPRLFFLNHPDYTPGPSNYVMWNCPISGDGNGCLPGGDLGLWRRDEPGTGEACTAARANAQVRSVRRLVEFSAALMAGTVCAAEVVGATLPEVGATVDMAPVLTGNLAGGAFTRADLVRLPDREGRPTYGIEIEGTLDGNGLLVSASHWADSADAGADAAGQVHGYVDRPDGMVERLVRRGFSVAYERAGGVFRYELRSATTPTSFAASALFDDEGGYRFEPFAQGQPGSPEYSGANFGRAEIDVATGLGTLHHAWQAGGKDEYTRVFQAHTHAVEGAPDQGFGYFGYGPAVTHPEVGSMWGMWCNWAGPGHARWTGSGRELDTPRVQAQRMARDVDGFFKPTLNRLRYAPTVSCDASPAQGFRYSTSADSNAALEALPPADVTNALVPYGDETIGQIPAIAPPTR